MIEIQKQLDFWVGCAQDDIVSAELLIREKRNLHGLFFCHLVIEKALKAHYVKSQEEVAPHTHNLIYLADKAGLEFDDETLIFLGILMRYQLQGRYPDYSPVMPDQLKVNDYLSKTKDLLQWLKERL